MMGGPLSVHAWGFFDKEGRRRLPDGIAPSDLSVYSMTTLIQRNVTHFGGDFENLRLTRTLDGLLIGAEFETPERPDGSAARMWHVVQTPDPEWRDPTTTTTRPEHEGAEGKEGSDG